MSWQQRWLARFYDRSRGWVDGTERFHRLVAAHVPRGTSILEIGAGPSNETSRFLATLGRVHGIDPDPDVAHNDALSGWDLLEGERYPYEDGRFGACVSNYVVEHVADARAHLAEIARVLAPGGVYVFRTPNLFHYVSLISRWTPHRIHLLLANRARALPEGSHDPYPTHYRLNTRRAIRRRAAEAGLETRALAMIEPEPMYGLGNRAAFLAFMAYERVVNASELLAGCRVNILGVLVRPN